MKRAWTAMLLLSLAGPLGAQLRPNTDYAVTQQQVYGMIRAALLRIGTPVESLQVKLQTDINTSVAEPQLHVLEVTDLIGRSAAEGKRLLAVRIACHTLTLCLPFYAVADVSSTPTESGSGAALHTNAASTERHSFESTVPLIAKGKQITLELQGDGMHIQLPAVSLQGGVLGQNIRVESLKQRRAYTATVLDANLVRGDF